MNPKFIHSGRFAIRWLIPIFVLLLSAFVTAHAQEIEKETAIYLKNGSVIRGKLVMSMFDEYMTVKTSETDHMEIWYDRIDRIVFGKDEISETSVIKPKDTTPPFFLKPGFMHMTEAGLIVGNENNLEGPAYSISTVNGYRFSPYFGAGLGIGVDGYNRITMLPIFLSFRGNLKKENVSPIYFLNAGYSAAWKNDNVDGIEYDYVRGGFMVHPGFGYMFTINKMALNLNLGYKIQQSSIAYSFENGWASPTEIQEERTRRRLTMSIGIAF